MQRRKFIRSAGVGIALAGSAPMGVFSKGREKRRIRLGGPLFEKFSTPEAWVAALKRNGYRAAYCPVGTDAVGEEIREYEKAAIRHDIVIAEVGAWSNPISPDDQEAAAAVKKCIDSLVLAEEIGARCCVNISGSRNPEHWAGPHRENLTGAVFEMVVEVTRKIIDAVKPARTFFVLEAMPWSFPDSTNSYLELIRAIDRSRFAVHIDPVNMVTGPRTFYENGKLIREMFTKLGPHIKSCHAKDIVLREDNYIPQLDEIRPGLGKLNYPVFLTELARLDDIPLMMEHLSTAEEYAKAAAYIRDVGESEGISL
ncbi:MAG: TIM barrel protein [Bacteroidales bacterium]